MLMRRLSHAQQLAIWSPSGAHAPWPAHPKREAREGRAAMDRGKSNVALWGALLGGGALLAYGISRRRAAKGPLLASSTVTVNAGPEQVYSFWREFENLPKFMHHLKSVKSQAERSQWKAVGPGGIGVSWEAEIVADRPNE